MWRLISSTLILVTTTVMCADPTFEPGCSFYGGQCIYSVKLGHQNQCDKPQTASLLSSTDGCCSDLSSKFAQLKDDVEKLKLKVDIMTCSMTASNQNVTDMEKQLQKALTDRDDIVAVLNRKEAELNTTKDHLADVMAKAANEIQTLRNSLTSAQRTISSCQTALGASTNTGHGNNVFPKDTSYDMTYINFNEEPIGFSYSLSRYGNKQIGRFQHGSSSSTGPKNEHTWGVGTGYYLGIDARSIGNSVSHTYRTSLNAETPKFSPANAYCIMFWYYMEGSNVRTLSVNIIINGGIGYPVYSRSGPDKSNQWQLVQIDLDSEYTSHQFRINFDMTTDAYYSYSSGRHVYHNIDGDIAMDDLYVFNTTCSSIPKVPSGAYRNYANNVTSFYTFHSKPMKWTDAYDACRNEGPWSALVSIQTKEEQAFLVNTIKHDLVLNAVGNNGFYTSGTDADAEHRFVWTNTGVSQPITNSHWHAGQPNNVAGNQDCLLMEYPNNDYEWGDVDCETKHPFICEVEIPGKV